MFRFKKSYVSIASLVFVSLILVSSANSATQLNGNGTIPYHFKDGEVISADVMNDLNDKIRNVVEGFSSPEELVGVWSCTTYSAETLCDVAGFLPTEKGILKSKTQNITFTCDAGSCRWIAPDFWPGSCRNVGGQLSQKYDITGNLLISLPAPTIDYTPSGQVHLYRKLSPNIFMWNITASLPATSFARCERQLLPPAIPSDLAVSVTNTTATLTWADNSTNETAFVILRKLGNGGNWTEIGTVTANTSIFSETLSSGTYSYRVMSRNTNGDSLGSNVVVVTIP